MPYLGHQSPSLSDQEVSPRDTPAAVGDGGLQLRAARAVARAAVNEEDRRMLLQTLGLWTVEP